MTRLGLDADEVARLNDQLQIDGQWLDAVDLCCVMSHLAAGEDTADPTNDRQLADFTELATAFAGVPLSLANSGGVLRGGGFHMALTRPGIALYGLHPAGHEAAGEQIDQAAKIQPAVTWQARILQRRTARAGDRVGYNGTHRLERDSRIVTLGVGYADGYPRALGNRASVEIAGETAPVVGRVSMDSITVDVTDIASRVLPRSTTPLYSAAVTTLPAWRVMPAQSVMKSSRSLATGRRAAISAANRFAHSAKRHWGMVKQADPGHKVSHPPFHGSIDPGRG